MKLINSNEPTIISDDFKSKEAEIDFSEGRDTYKELIKMSLNAIESISMIANESEHPQVYKTLSEMIRNTAEINEKMINLHRIKEDIKKSEKEDKKSSSGNNLTQNNYFTSEELAKKFITEN